MSDYNLNDIEISREQAKKAVALMKSMERLTSNRDFKKVVLEGYFEKQASQLVLLKGDPSMQGAEDQASIVKAIDAIGEVRQYFNQIMQMGRQMERQLQALDEMERELAEEDGDEE